MLGNESRRSLRLPHFLRFRQVVTESSDLHGAAVCRGSAKDVCKLPIGDTRDYGFAADGQAAMFRMYKYLVDDSADGMCPSRTQSS